MSTKTWKLGEVCQGGIITVNTTKTKVIVIGKEWDYSQGSNKGSNQSNAKEFTRAEFDLNLVGSREVDNFLNSLTTSYHSGEILKWIESKVEFKNFW